MEKINFDKYSMQGPYHWDDISRNPLKMNTFVQARYNIILDCIARLELRRVFDLLDVGCGDGALTGKIYDRFKCNIYGIDPSSVALGFAKSKFNKLGYKGVFKRIDGYSYTFPDSTFDVVICADVIEHVQEPVKMLTEMKRVLKPEGCLIIGTPVKSDKIRCREYHIKEWSPKEFASLCEKIFGHPEKIILSCPFYWHKLYSLPYKGLFQIGRYSINLLNYIGINVFEGNYNRPGRSYLQQTLLLRK